MPWFWWPVTRLAPWTLRFNSIAVYTRLVVDEVALGKVLLSVPELTHQYYSTNAPYFIHRPLAIYRVSQEERTKLREGVPYVKLYRYNPKHLHPKLNGYGDNGQRKVWTSCISAFYTPRAVSQAAPPTRSSDCVQSVRWLVLRRTSSTQRDKTVLHCC